MWYENENAEPVRPGEIDTTSSRVYVYVRKDIVPVAEGDLLPAHYRWREMKIPKEIWEICEQTFSHEAALDDVYAALTELAGMIVGE